MISRVLTKVQGLQAKTSSPAEDACERWDGSGAQRSPISFRIISNQMKSGPECYPGNGFLDLTHTHTDGRTRIIPQVRVYTAAAATQPQSSASGSGSSSNFTWPTASAAPGLAGTFRKRPLSGPVSTRARESECVCVRVCVRAWGCIERKEAKESGCVCVSQNVLKSIPAVLE